MQHFRTEFNPITGAREDFYWDDKQKSLVQRTRHDVTDVIEKNKRQANATVDGRKFGTGHMMHHVADIPLGVVVELRKKHGVDVFSPEHKPKLLRLLDSPEYRYLKTTVARLNSKGIRG